VPSLYRCFIQLLRNKAAKLGTCFSACTYFEEERFTLKGIKTIGAFVFLVAGLLLVNPSAGNASEFNFAVTPITPKNQIDQDNTYFDLLLSPNQITEANVNLRNDTDKEVTVGISLNTATTNSNVVVEYGHNDLPRDKSLEYDLKDYVQYPESITLKPKSEQTVPFKIKMPDKAFNGVIAGGITFKEEGKNETKSSGKQGLSIENEYSYVVALLMRQNEKEVQPNLILHDVKPGQINARNTILANLQNDQKTYINQVAVNAQITKKGSDKVLYKEEKDDLQIAPNSSFSFPISLKEQALEPGDYQLTMTVSGNENQKGAFTQKVGDKTNHFEQQWTFKKAFRIDGKTAKELNEKDVTLKQDNTWLYILIGILILLVVNGLIIGLIWRKKNEANKKDA